MSICKNKTQLLVVTGSTVRPDQSSGDRRLIELLRLMQRRAMLNCCSDGTGDGTIIPARFAKEYLNDQVLFRGRSWRPNREVLAAAVYDTAFIEFWHVASHWLPVIRKRQPWMPVIVDSLDVHFVREEAAAYLGCMDSRLVAENKRSEIALYNVADAVVVVSEADCAALRAEAVERPIFIIPNIVRGRPRLLMPRPPSLLFVGGFAHDPNVDGVLWFVEHCWTRIRAAVPSATFRIVGSKPTEKILALSAVPGIVVIGYVEDTGPYLDAAAVSVAPLRYGGGMKGKVCEAMAAGLPVVSTSFGVQGIPATDGSDVRIGDTPDRFADAVIWVLNNQEAAAELGLKGQALIAELCGEAAVAEELDRMFREVAGVTRSAADLLRWQAWAHAYRAAKSVRDFVRRQ